MGRIKAGSKIVAESKTAPTALEKKMASNASVLHRAPETKAKVDKIVGGYAFKWLSRDNKSPFNRNFNWEIPTLKREARITKLTPSTILIMCARGLHVARPCRMMSWGGGDCNLYLAKWWAPFVYDNYEFSKIACTKVQLLCPVTPIMNSLGFREAIDFVSALKEEMTNKTLWDRMTHKESNLLDQAIFEALGFDDIAFMMTQETFR